MAKRALSVLVAVMLASMTAVPVFASTSTTKHHMESHATAKTMAMANTHKTNKEKSSSKTSEHHSNEHRSSETNAMKTSHQEKK
jgi:Ca2+/H+ antiporter